MPIIVRGNAGTELKQGDILKGRPTFFTGASDEPSMNTKGADFLLVLSRDCRAIRDPVVSVLPVVEFKLGKVEDDFERLRRVLEVDRDGGRTPDLLYLGPIDGETKRYAARLAVPFAIEVPSGDLRQPWVDEERVATLERDFLEHLHTRVFTAFARKGFDDHGWLPNEDLDMLVRRGAADIATLLAEIAKIKADQDTATLKEAKSELAKLEKALPRAEQRLRDLRGKVGPFEEEQLRRGKPSGL